MQRLFDPRFLLGLLLVGAIAGSSILCVGQSGAGRAAEAATPDREAVQRATTP